MQILNLQDPSTDEEYEQRNGYDSLGLDEEIMINGVGVPREIFSLKALVIDEPTQRMLSTITKMTDIRDSNVTLHSKITAKRDSVVDTPVIYLIEPTEENIELVVQDAERALYDFMFFYFTRPAPGPALENLACKLARIGAADKVMKVQDNYLSFFCHTQN